MDTSSIITSVAALISSFAQLLWPIIILAILIIYRREFRELISRVKKWSLMGNEVEIESLTAAESIVKTDIEQEEIKITDKEIDESLSGEQKLRTNSQRKFLSGTELALLEKKALDKMELGMNFQIQRQVKIAGYWFDGYGINRKGVHYVFETKTFQNIATVQDKIDLFRITYNLRRILPLLILNAHDIANYLRLSKKYPKIVLMLILILDTDQDLTEVQKKAQEIITEMSRKGLKVVVKAQVQNLPKLLTTIVQG